MRVGVLGGGPSGQEYQANLAAIAACDRVVTMNASIRLLPERTDLYCTADPAAIERDMPFVKAYAEAGGTIVQGIVTDHPQGYGSAKLGLGERYHHYGVSDLLYHGRTVGIMALRLAITELGGTELLIAGFDGYDPRTFSRGERWARASNAAAAASILMLQTMHPGVVWHWCEGSGEPLQSALAAARESGVELAIARFALEHGLASRAQAELLESEDPQNQRGTLERVIHALALSVRSQDEGLATLKRILLFYQLNHWHDDARAFDIFSEGAEFATLFLPADPKIAHALAHRALELASSICDVDAVVVERLNEIVGA